MDCMPNFIVTIWLFQLEYNRSIEVDDVFEKIVKET